MIAKWWNCQEYAGCCHQNDLCSLPLSHFLSSARRTVWYACCPDVLAVRWNGCLCQLLAAGNLSLRTMRLIFMCPLESLDMYSNVWPIDIALVSVFLSYLNNKYMCTTYLIISVYYSTCSIISVYYSTCSIVSVYYSTCSIVYHISVLQYMFYCLSYQCTTVHVLSYQCTTVHVLLSIFPSKPYRSHSSLLWWHWICTARL